jgi:hypothetical protein
VLLRPIRDQIFAVYQEVARPLFPDPALAATWTPRELLHHVAHSQLLFEELAALTHLVETACFGPHLPDTATLAEAERLAQAAAHA